MERMEINAQVFRTLREKGKGKNKNTKHERARQKEKINKGEGEKGTQQRTEWKSQKRKSEKTPRGRPEGGLQEGGAQCLWTEGKASPPGMMNVPQTSS